MAKLRVDKIASVGVSTETTGSVFFDGTGDYLATEVSNDFALGTNDFTFEMWVYYESRSTGDTPAVLDSTTTTYAPLIGYIENDASTNGHAVVYISANGSSWGIASNKTFGLITAKQWYHLAISRSGSNFYLFKDGILTDSFTSSSAIYQGANQIGFGRIQSSVYFDGYISNARMCNGHAVYTENFTPPTRELEVHPETVFLGLYDGENIFAEKTGKIIAAYGDRTSSPTPTATDSPIGITTFQPGLTRNVDNTFGPVFQGGAGFTSQNWLTLPKGTTTDRFPNFAGVDAASARGVFMGGGNTPRVNTIDYVTISTLGDATDFGDLSTPIFNHAGGASDTRGISAGGTNPSNTNLIEYVTIQSTGNAQDFGDLSSATEQMGGASNSTRCLFAGGYTTEHVNTIDFITISTSGNAFDFGDLTATKRGQGGLASPNRALFAAGANPGVSVNIDYVTIMSTGNAVDFGDISGSGGRQGNNGCSTNTRGCWGGGYDGPAGTDAIQYVTIATLGNAQPFGDLSVATFYSGATSSSTRGVWGGGYKPAVSNTIEYITMATLGDANNFGDLSQARVSTTSVSNGHGGLG